jgi:nitrate/nitrite transporter NarK
LSRLAGRDRDVALGLGTGAVFKLVREWFPDRVGSVTGVSAPPRARGFVPALVMPIVKTVTGGFALMALVALACLAVLRGLRAGEPVVAAAL